MQFEKISTLSFAAIPFAVVVSVCYLSAYWGTFDVDVFSYITASEVLVFSSVPLLSVGVASIIGMLIGNLSSVYEEKSTKNFKLINIVVLIILGITLIFGDELRWMIYPIFLVALIMFLLGVNGAFITDGKPNLRMMVLILILIYLPAQAYGVGKSHSHRIKSGKGFKFIVNEISGVKKASDTDLRYLGKVGGSLFIYHVTEQEVLIVNISDISPLRLKVRKQIIKE
jgi:hypothetical protein